MRTHHSIAERRFGSGVLAAFALFLSAALAPAFAFAAVQPCTEAGLDAAIAAGGTNTFSCAGATTIAITTSKTISAANLVLDGGGLLTVSGGNARRIFLVNSGAAATFQNMAINNGFLTSGNGAGILNFGTATIANTTFSGNTIASTNGGGGAAIMNVGAMTIDKSSFLNNSVTTANPATSNADGAAINNSGTSLTISNSTFSGNSAGRGGVIVASTPISIYNSTLVGNSASVSCGAGAIFAVGTTTLYNTIVANNTSGGACRPNCNGSVTAGPDSISDNADCGASITQTTFALINLGALTGSPAYFPLNPGSAATDTGSTSICAAAPVNNTSQNGIARSTDGKCDVGSFESAAAAAGTPALTIAPTSLNWINVQTGGAGGAQNVTLTSTGSAPLIISSISPPAAPFIVIGSGNCATLPATLAVGASCTLTYDFKPSAAGAFSTSVDIASNTSAGAASINLTGTGIAPPPPAAAVSAPAMSPTMAFMLALVLVGCGIWHARDPAIRRVLQAGSKKPPSRRKTTARY